MQAPPSVAPLLGWPPGALIATPLPDLDAQIAAANVTMDRPFLLIGVLSSRRTYRRRVTIRQTWARFITHTATHAVHVRFVIGRNEVCESKLCLQSATRWRMSLSIYKRGRN